MTAPGEPDDVEDDTPALFELAIVQVPPKRAARKPARTVARTATGESSQDIINAWVNWHIECETVSPPTQMIKQIAQQVKGLIQDGYDTVVIKKALAFWTRRQLDDVFFPPHRLTPIAFDLTRRGPGGERFRQQVTAAINQYTDSRRDPTAGRKAQREQRNIDTTQDWLQRKRDGGTG